uniref:Uncharacterized protein n=1 Tax=Rhizophora mucronata TaxID=61149 RepID=A0A2P2K914_RHIMU
MAAELTGGAASTSGTLKRSSSLSSGNCRFATSSLRAYTHTHTHTHARAHARTQRICVYCASENGDLA